MISHLCWPRRLVAGSGFARWFVLLAVTFLVGLAASSTPSSAQTQLTFYVDDVPTDGDGSIDSPFNSLKSARNRVRQIPVGLRWVKVSMRGGTYPLSETLHFDDTDSGMDDAHPVEYTAHWSNGAYEPVLIHGGMSLPNSACPDRQWAFVKSRLGGTANEWKLDNVSDCLPNSPIDGTRFRDLYIRNRRLMRSRHPNVDNPACRTPSFLHIEYARNYSIPADPDHHQR